MVPFLQVLQNLDENWSLYTVLYVEEILFNDLNFYNVTLKIMGSKIFISHFCKFDKNLQKADPTNSRTNGQVSISPLPAPNHDARRYSLFAYMEGKFSNTKRLLIGILGQFKILSRYISCMTCSYLDQFQQNKNRIQKEKSFLIYH